MVVVGILIVIIIYIINCRANRVDDIAEKTPHLDELPQSNFIYARPPMGKVFK